MEIKAVKKGNNNYIVNNIVIKANNFKEALKMYVNQTMAGSNVIFTPRG